MNISYALRERIDGQAEVIEVREAVIGTFAEVDHARQFCEMLNKSALREAVDGLGDRPIEAESPGMTLSGPTMPKPARPAPAPAAASPGYQENQRAERDDRAEAPSAAVSRPSVPVPAPAAVAVEKPCAPVKMCADLGEEIMNPAFERLEHGEKLQAVAADLGVPWPSLRGAYAGYKSRRQREIARSGKAECSLCGKEFMPSVTNPDTCSRCSKTMER